MRATSESVEWIFLAIYLGLEILSAACDQASSPRRPHFALFGMLFSIAAVLISIGELIYRGKRERVVFRRWGMLWWFYHPPPPRHTPFGTLPDIYGLVAGISQCICSIVQYVYCLRHADSPLKASLLPALFLVCLGGLKLCNNRMNASTEETLLHPNLENNAPANTPSPDNQEVEVEEQEQEQEWLRQEQVQERQELGRQQLRRLQKLRQQLPQPLLHLLPLPRLRLPPQEQVRQQRLLLQEQEQERLLRHERQLRLQRLLLQEQERQLWLLRLEPQQRLLLQEQEQEQERQQQLRQRLRLREQL